MSAEHFLADAPHTMDPNTPECYGVICRQEWYVNGTLENEKGGGGMYWNLHTITLSCLPHHGVRRQKHSRNGMFSVDAHLLLSSLIPIFIS